MRHYYLFLFYSLVSLFITTVNADSPIDRKLPPFKERVQAGSYVFAGVVEQVIALNNNLQVMDEKSVSSKHKLLQVRVTESLTPFDWHPEKPVLVHISDGWRDTKEMRKALIGKQSIYVTGMVLLPPWGPVFVEPFDSQIVESLDNLEEARKAVKANPTGAQQWAQLNWISQCLKEVETIQPGMTRAEVNKLLRQATILFVPGATSPGVKKGTYNLKRYALIKCPLVTVEVEFAPAAAPSAGSKTLVTQTEHSTDKVIHVSKPSLEWVYTW